MCARYTLHERMQRLADAFALKNVVKFEPHYNRAPSSEAPIIIQDRIGLAQWGLMPEWAANKPNMSAPHNARIETASEKPFFKQAWRKRRCLVPANGFYEWQTIQGKKQPVYFHYDDVFAFAGLWEKAGEHVTFTILTQAASGAVRSVHSRMPVILPPAAYQDWFNGNRDIVTDSQDYMQKIQARPVSSDVNNARNNAPALLNSV